MTPTLQEVVHPSPLDPRAWRVLQRPHPIHQVTRFYRQSIFIDSQADLSVAATPFPQVVLKAFLAALTAVLTSSTVA